jgi:hypothetical protein
LAARLRYGKDLYVLQHHSEDGSTCKLLCRCNGEIVGADVLGDSAVAVMEAVAIAMHGRLKIQQMSTLADFTEGRLGQTAAQFAQQQYARDPKRQLRLEKWFMVRRDFDL